LPAGCEVVEFDMRRWEAPGGIVPCRNLHLVAIASQYGEAIGLGSTKGDRVLDGSAKFAEDASALLSYLWQPQHWTTGRAIRIEVPFKGWTKTEIVAGFIHAGGDAERLAADSYSCYRGGPTECMACLCCARKWVAFALNGVSMPGSAAAFVKAELVPLIRAGRSQREDEDADILRAVGEG
jgi:7-cyano-7-deazaguanine synthase in queuosine biosynthesis